MCKTLGKQIQDGLAAEGLRRLQEHAKTMTAKIEEGFRSEQQARQQAQSEMMKGFKDEKNARQEEMKSLNIGSGSTRCGGVGSPSTLARPQLLPPSTVKYSFQGRCNLKAGSLSTKSVVFRTHGQRGHEFRQRSTKKSAE